MKSGSMNAKVPQTCGAASRCVLQVLFVVRNYAQLCVTYGPNLGFKAGRIGTAVMHTLYRRAYMRGGSITKKGPDHFLVSLETSANEIQQLLLIESLLLDLTASVRHDGVDVLASVSAILMDGHKPFDGLPVCEEAPLPPPPADLAWQVGYEQDMLMASSFYKRLPLGLVRLDLQAVRHSERPERTLYQEALLRVDCGEDHATMQPVELLPGLERLGMVRLLDRCVVHAVIDRLQAEPDLQLACNISRQSVVLDAWWASALQRLSADPHLAQRLTLELTESAQPGHSAELAFVERMHGLGVQIAIDDFGMGASNLEFALAARPDVIKIDRRFLETARCDATGRMLLITLILLCGVMARRVVVEGAERLDDLEQLARIGGVYVQGYALGKPASPKPPIVLSAPSMPSGWEP